MKKTTAQITAAVFMSGTSQAVRLPKAYRFACDSVSIRREGDSVVLTPIPTSWDELCAGQPDDIDDQLSAINDDDLEPLEKRVRVE